MGIDTKGLILGKVSAAEIASMLPPESRVVEIRHDERAASRRPFVDEEGHECRHRSEWVDFIDTTDKSDPEQPEGRMRSMHVFWSSRTSDYEEVTGPKAECTVFSLGWAGNAESIIRHVVEGRGGWFLSEDASGQWAPVVQTRDVSEEDILSARRAIVAQAALKAMHDAMNLLGLEGEDRSAVIDAGPLSVAATYLDEAAEAGMGYEDEAAPAAPRA